MKKAILALALGASLLAPSCSQERLDIPQKAATSTLDFYKSDSDAEALMTATYAEFFQNCFASAWPMPNFGSPQRMILNYSSDDIMAAGGDETDHFELRVFDEFRYDAANPWLECLYKGYYAAIYNCNLVRENFEGKTPVERQMIAEASVLSAYIHMMLALSFNNPPLLDKTISADQFPVNAESQEAILSWCIEQCDSHMADLKERSGASDIAGSYRITKGFAQFVAGKCAMFKGDFAKAAQELKPLVESPNYALVSGDKFRDLFHVEGDGCSEKIFDLHVAYNPSNGDSWNEQMRGGWMMVNVANWRGDDIVGGKTNLQAVAGWGGVSVNYQFADKMYSHEPDSYRRKATFLTSDEFMYGEGIWPSDDKCPSLAAKKADPNRGLDLHACKNPARGGFGRSNFMEIKNIEAPNDKSARSDGNMANTNLARLGEAYLLYAEACLKNGNAAEGLKYLNAIQERAGAPKTDLTMETLMDEKQYELWYEGCRFHDLVRWNKQNNLDIKAIYDKVTDNIPYQKDTYFVKGHELEGKEHQLIFDVYHPLKEAGITTRYTTGKHEYFPFPQTVMNLNPSLVQHENW